MSPSPETRPSLLVRLTDRADQAAWQEFANIYTPVVYRLALRRGLQHADAEDLSQQVLTAISKAIDRWQTDPTRAKFRTWLHRIAQNQIINALTRAAPDRATGDPTVMENLNEQAALASDSEVVRLELRREVFRWAAEQIRHEFRPATWNAFWLTAVENLTVEQTAKRLELSCGAIYAARSRIMRWLKEKVCEFDDEAETAEE
ncbi:MAG TPA: sigma-70 family RNA polymerase sigma factor [Pirellulales bacterium]|jgi:RNA polymerase sigma-70 factor (ECF subfamily)|nr:sigma-70 family RNA polymerase sigma factor [Pirellulales bacterium]